MPVYYSISRELPLQVEMRNKLNKKAIELHAELAEMLEPYVNKKVVKITPYDNWVKEIGQKIKEIDGRILNSSYPRYRLVFNFSSSSVWAVLTIIFNDKEAMHSYYKEATFTVCRLDNNHLVSVLPVGNLKTDYDANHIHQQDLELSDLKAKVYELEHALEPFAVHR